MRPACHISQSNQAARERDEADQLRRAVFDEAPIGMAVISAEGEWLQVNLALLEATGYSRDALLATPFAELLTPESGEAYRDYLKQAFSLGLRTFRMNAAIVRSDGEALPAQLDASVARDYLGEPLHLVCHITPALG